jgi:hypothetical protein
MKMRFPAILVAAVIALAGLPPHAGADEIGVVKSVSGEAIVVRGGASLTPEINFFLHRGDVIKTGATGNVGVIFEDDTLVSMGPSSELAIDDFLFEPAQEELSLVVRMIRGSMSFLSGEIGKLAPENVKLETPDATIGMRGTRLLIKVE